MAQQAIPEQAKVRPGALGRLRARLKARPDTEHEQGILRLIISSLVFLYLLMVFIVPEESRGRAG